MAIVTKTVLKTYFEQGDIPTQGQYVDLIDSQFGLGEVGTTQIIQGTISASAARVEFLELKKLYIPGLGISSHVDVANRTGVKVGSTFTIGKTLEVVGDINTTGIISGSSMVASGDISAANFISTSGTTSGTNTGDVTLTGTPDYLTISNQVITRNAIDLTADVTGLLPDANLSANTAHLDTTQIFTGIKSFTEKIYAIGGIKLSTTDPLPSLKWAASSTYVIPQNKTRFQLPFTFLPTFANGVTHSEEHIIIQGTMVTAQSIIIIQPQKPASGATPKINFKIYDLESTMQAAGGYFKISPYNFSGNDAGIPSISALTFNFTIL